MCATPIKYALSSCAKIGHNLHTLYADLGGLNAFVAVGRDGGFRDGSVPGLSELHRRCEQSLRQPAIDRAGFTCSRICCVRISTTACSSPSLNLGGRSSPALLLLSRASPAVLIIARAAFLHWQTIVTFFFIFQLENLRVQ